ncbi:MAG: hypothetical protein Q9225_003018, partial [Loekoesia sp. 1 TL-2023]
MSSRKYNEYLDADHSDDEDLSARDSDDAQEIKGRITSSRKPSKRQKTSHQSSDDETDNELDQITTPAPVTVSGPEEPPLESAPAKEPPDTTKSSNSATTKPLRSKTTSSRPHRPG